MVVLDRSGGNGIPLDQIFHAWDSNWYLQIAREGFTWAHTLTGHPADLHLPVQTSFPFFPLLPLALALAGEAVLSGAERLRALGLLGPSLLALLLWSGYLMVISGNPLIWVQAKHAWTEVTLLNLTTFPGWFPLSQLVAGLVALALLLLGWSAQPWGWRLFGLLWIAPSFVLGMVGFPRYAGSCFPVFASLGDRVARFPRSVRWLLLGGSAGLLALQTVQVGLLQRWVP